MRKTVSEWDVQQVLNKLAWRYSDEHSVALKHLWMDGLRQEIAPAATPEQILLWERALAELTSTVIDDLVEEARVRFVHRLELLLDRQEDLQVVPSASGEERSHA